MLKSTAYAIIGVTAALALVAPLQWANHAACMVTVMLGAIVIREA